MVGNLAKGKGKDRGKDKCRVKDCRRDKDGGKRRGVVLMWMCYEGIFV